MNEKDSLDTGLDSLAQRVIKDVEGIPWQDHGIPKEQILTSVKYFIKAYTNDVANYIKEQNAAQKRQSRS